MAKLLSDKTANRMLAGLDAIESMTRPKSKAVRRRLRSSSPKAGRFYVEVKSENTCDVWETYGDFTSGEDPIEEGATLLAPNLTSNPFEDGDTGFADESEQNGETVYIIDAYLLV